MKYLPFIVLVGLLLYLPSLRNGFVWDDEEQIVNNSAIRSFSNIPLLFTGSTFNSGGAALSGQYYKPLMPMMFTMIYSLAGDAPWAFHLVQTVLHIANAVMVFALMYFFIKNTAYASVAAFIFLIHPIQVEAVVYSSALQDVLFFFFGMSALLWIVISGKTIRWYDYCLAGLLVLCSLLSKETGILFVIIIGVYMLLYQKRMQGVWWATTSFLVLCLYGFLRIGVAGIAFRSNSFTPIAALGLMDRLSHAPAIVWHYIHTFLFPWQLSIGQHWVISQVGFVSFYVPLLFSCITLILIVWWGRRIHVTHYWFFFAWFLVGLGAHLQIIPLDMTVADRWFYVPMVGLVGMMGSIKLKVKSSEFIKVMMGIVFVALFIRSSVRIHNWRDGMTLYVHDIHSMSESFDVQNNYGVELFRAKNYDEAKFHFQKSTDLAPLWWTNWNNLGVIVEREGDLDTALVYYKKAMDNGGYYLAYENYASLIIKRDEHEKALRELKRYANEK